MVAGRRSTGRCFIMCTGLARSVPSPCVCLVPPPALPPILHSETLAKHVLDKCLSGSGVWGGGGRQKFVVCVIRHVALTRHVALAKLVASRLYIHHCSDPLNSPRSWSSDVRRIRSYSVANRVSMVSLYPRLSLYLVCANPVLSFTSTALSPRINTSIP